MRENKRKPKRSQVRHRLGQSFKKVSLGIISTSPLRVPTLSGKYFVNCVLGLFIEFLNRTRHQINICNLYISVPIGQFNSDGSLELHTIKREGDEMANPQNDDWFPTRISCQKYDTKTHYIRGAGGGLTPVRT